MESCLFHLSWALLVYTYAGYPLLLALLAALAKKTVRREAIFPSVTVVVPVHNEEKLMGAKIDNCLAFDYPQEKLKIVVASDRSTDRTEEIVESRDSRRVRLVRLPRREGKVAAQNRAVEAVDTDIVIFTDVAIRTDRDCVRLIVENFGDEKIGAVSCRDQIVQGDTGIQGESRYIGYDMMVRKFSSQMGSIAGVTGGFYAVRREIAEGGWDPAFPPDFYVALKCFRKGYRVVEDRRVLAYYKTAARDGDEFRRKVRTINRGMHALFAHKDLMNPFRYGLTAVQLISHKLLRWMTPLFLAALLLSSLLAWRGSLPILLALVGQCTVYALGLAGWLGGERLKAWSALKLPFFFCMANLALLKAWWEFFRGKKYLVWEPTKR